MCRDEVVTGIDGRHVCAHGRVLGILSGGKYETLEVQLLFVMLYLGREADRSSRVGLTAELTGQGLETTWRGEACLGLVWRSRWCRN